jgi:anti-sigma regulatory factor (Ser/Thr protein kinase)
MRRTEQPLHPHEYAGTWSLDGLAGTVGAARDVVRAFLDASRPPLTRAAVDDVLIAVSELVTNAVRHAPGPCTLRLSDSGWNLTIDVSDTSTAQPRPRPPDLATGNGGFGWHLLHAVACDFTVLNHPDGKTVRVVLPVRGDPPR